MNRLEMLKITFSSSHPIKCRINTINIILNNFKIEFYSLYCCKKCDKYFSRVSCIDEAFNLHLPLGFVSSHKSIVPHVDINGFLTFCKKKNDEIVPI